jgi:hypothetical protein
MSHNPLAFDPAGLKFLGGIETSVYQIRVTAPDLQWLRFEYHPKIGKVYWADMRARLPVGEVLHEHVPDTGSAHNAVNSFLRGYRLAQKEAAHGQGSSQAPVA